MIKNLVRQLIFEIFILLARIFQCQKRRGIPVFVYHSIDDSGSPLSTPPSIFEKRMAYLQKHRFEPITASQAIARIQSGHNFHRCVAITFDDAYVAINPTLEILTKQRLQTTIFVPSGFLGKTNLWDINNTHYPQLPIMTCDHLKKLQHELGSHTRTHPNLPDIEDSQLEHELTGARINLEQAFSNPVPLLAYPFGAYNPHVMEMAKHAGYKAAFTTQLGYLTPHTHPFAIPRFPSNLDDVQFRMVVHGAYPWYRRLQNHLFGTP